MNVTPGKTYKVSGTLYEKVTDKDGNRHVGVVLTNNYFTSSAKELAEKNGIILWDRKRLLKMIEFSSHDS